MIRSAIAESKLLSFEYYSEKGHQPRTIDRKLLIADGSHIMWIPGECDRMSEKYKITDATHRILWINLFDAEEKEDGRKLKSYDL
jgi:hypothetical protein